MKYSFTFAALAAAAYAKDTAKAYEQCGGQGYTGATSCVEGFHCFNYSEFYSQCVPGSGVDSSASSKVQTSASSVAASSAVSAVISSVSSVAPVVSSAVSSARVSTAVVVSSSSNAVVSSSSPVKDSISVATTLQTKAVASSTSTSTPATSTAVSSASANGSYPSTSGTKFVIDGETGYFAGTNSYWIGFLTNDSDVDLVMQHIADSGLKILRVWGFNDVTTVPSSGTVYFQSFAGSEPVINTGADGLERLDYVVKSAEAHGVKLIINFVNNWTDYGGMAAYFNYAGITDNTQWYNNTKAQTAYQTYIKAVVTRYPTSSAIFGWELANEPRCTGCDLSILNTWISTTAKYIKTLDANRMITTGEEGFGLSYGDDSSYPYTTGAAGSNFTANCAIPEIDFCTLHLYPESWSVTPTQEWGNAWISNHALACAAVGKPCLLEEYGASDNCTVESDWQATALKTAGVGADLFWQYGDTISSGQTSQDGNTVYYGEDLFTCLVTDHVKAIDDATVATA